MISRAFLFWSTWLSCLFSLGGCVSAQLRRQPTTLGAPMVGGPVQAGAQLPSRTTPWLVYSDRDNNPTYRKASLGTGYKKLRFREAFYVAGERNGFLKLIRYDPAFKIGTVFLPRRLSEKKKAVSVGWVPKDQLLLTSHALRDSATTLPTVYFPALASSEVLRNVNQYFRHDTLRLFARPELTPALPTRLRLYDLAYAYKFSADGRAALLGAADWFVADSAASALLGWVPTTALQPLGSGLFVEADTVHAAAAPVALYDSPRRAAALAPGQSLVAHGFASVPWVGAGAASPRLPLLQPCSPPGAPPVWQLGLPVPLLETDNFVLNVNGQHVSRQQIVTWRNRSRVFNIVFVLEDGPAMRPYWNDLVNALQSIVSQLVGQGQSDVWIGTVLYHQAYAPGRKDDALGRYLATQQLTRDAARIIDQLSRRRPTWQPSPSVNQPLGTGVGRALEMLRGHAAENNVVVLVGINGDGYPVAQLPTMRAALRATEARLLAFQAAAPADTLANNFVLQAQQLVLQSALEGGKTKRERLVNSALVIPTPAFDLRLGARNVYRLNFPTRSMVPGWVLFPTKKKRLPMSLLVAATDSLLLQQRFDAQQVQAALAQSSATMLPLRSHLSPQINRTLQARLESPVSTLAADVFALRAYPFYRQAYARFTPDSSAFRQLRLVTADTYEALGHWLSQLAADGLDPAHPPDARVLASRFRELARYGGPAASGYTLSQALSKLVGLPAKHSLLRRLRLADLTQPARVPASTWAELLYLLRERRNFYLSIPTFPNSRFSTNGRVYYWLSEDLFR